MKKIVFACIAALISATAFAATAYMDTVSRQISWTRPDKAVHPETKQEFKNPSDGTLAACGIVQVEYEDCDFKYRLWGWEPSPWCRAMNAAERQAVDDAEAQAQAEADAAAQAGLPAVFPNGIAVVDESGHHVEFIPDLADGVVIPVQVSNSPLTAEQRATMKAEALAARAALKAAQAQSQIAAKSNLVAAIDSAKNAKQLGDAIVAWIDATEAVKKKDGR